MSEQKTILIIEDEEVILDVLSTKLRKKGFKVITAKDGEIGLSLIKREKPDLVLLDIIMPKKDGYEVLESVQKNKQLKNIPIIIISNSGQPVEIDKALDLGAQDYLIKAQFDIAEVIDKVNTALDEKSDKVIKNNREENINKNAPMVMKPPKIKGGAKNILVLIVEDDQFLRELISRKLSQEKGMSIATAADGKEGIESIIKNKPDLVLLDIILPIQDGFEVLNTIRKHSNTSIAQTPVILLTNLGQDSDIKKGKQLGANDYLVKTSLTTDDIVKKIKDHV